MFTFSLHVLLQSFQFKLKGTPGNVLRLINVTGNCVYFWLISNCNTTKIFAGPSFSMVCKQIHIDWAVQWHFVFIRTVGEASEEKKTVVLPGMPLNNLNEQ